MDPLRCGGAADASGGLSACAAEDTIGSVEALSPHRVAVSTAFVPITCSDPFGRSMTISFPWFAATALWMSVATTRDTPVRLKVGLSG